MPHKTLHIVDKADYDLCKNHFCPYEGSHFENLPNGKILIVANFNDEGQEDRFLKTTENSRLSLPHPTYEANLPISAEHAKHLHNHPWSVPEHDKPEHKLAKAKTLTVHDVAKRFAKHNPKFRLF